jgi:acyl carrier protein
MSENEDTAARVRNLIVNHLGVDDDAATDEARICDDLGADSLDCVELIMTAEEQFGCEITDDEAEKVATVGDAIKLIGDKLGAKTPV